MILINRSRVADCLTLEAIACQPFSLTLRRMGVTVTLISSLGTQGTA
ncbi:MULTISPECIES: hypothetical protein [Planktothricoides]|uniref:Uncharacterized protein n=1 Tax=Planktothricoides raciborskii FACHB-1370 TaxID=2949576 RepID=A0ABR8EF98_9CYAN|nr:MULTISPECIES: hypothetical protein [Planktothricoides]MBD2545514.1 hypothetical protein [Planktothricoides raciborskii FACHB-1370]MBD2583418.1 hypothetical protein [Planktothricoides raciborskii FACHB-1261]